MEEKCFLASQVCLEDQKAIIELPVYKCTYYSSYVWHFVSFVLNINITRRAQNHSGLTRQQTLRFLCYSSHTCSRSCIWHFNTWQFHVYPLQDMYRIILNISRYDTLIVADISWWVRYLKFFSDCSWHFAACICKVPGIDCNWHFMVRYLSFPLQSF